MKVIETQELTVGYGKKAVVTNINQEMLKGQYICLLGPNGSGKTTILRTLARLLSPIKGAIYHNNHVLSSIKSDELAKTMAVVLTDRISPGLITVFEFTALGRYPHTGFLGKLTKDDIIKVEEALQLVGAYELSDRYYNELSDGEKQKVLLARALAQEPEVIILDEPTVHLDLRHRIDVIEILRNFCHEKGITVIVSLHDVDIALKISEIVILVKNGQIVDYGCPEDIIKGDTISSLYDLNKVYFNNNLGTMELKGNNEGDLVYVVAGAGSGVKVYRLLSKHGFRIITGIIHENDIDYHISKSLGAKIISENPFVEVSNDSYIEARDAIDESWKIIDAGFPVGTMNHRNIDLVISAIEQRKEVYTLRSREEASLLYGEMANNLSYCNGKQSIVELLQSRAAIQ